jgi:hypothetical protein
MDSVAVNLASFDRQNGGVAERNCSISVRHGLNPHLDTGGRGRCF